MRSTTYNFLLTVLFTTWLVSCDKRTNENQKFNQLYVTEKGDSLETGLWVLEPGPSGVGARGHFKDGFRDGVWHYQAKGDSAWVNWTVFTKDSLKLNLPDSLKFTEQEPPVVFLGRLRDDAEHSYYTLLQYNLKEVNSSVYGYIFQYIQSLENSSVEKLEEREIKKFYFKTTEVFRVKVNLKLEGERKYQAISYIFTSNDILYDLTFREELNRVDEIYLEVFNDILYSFQTTDFDPFDFNNTQFHKEEVIDIRTPIQN
jgi:hypothetical protein